MTERDVKRKKTVIERLKQDPLVKRDVKRKTEAWKELREELGIPDHAQVEADRLVSQYQGNLDLAITHAEDSIASIARAGKYYRTREQEHRAAVLIKLHRIKKGESK